MLKKNVFLTWTGPIGREQLWQLGSTRRIIGDKKNRKKDSIHKTATTNLM